MKNDLWYYSILNNNWTWYSGNKTNLVKGKYNDSNNNIYPGSRYSSNSWFDEENQRFWLFGGYGKGSSGNIIILSKYIH